MEAEGYITRQASPSDDRRAVLVVLTREGRSLWRDANIAYRRAVQRHFAGVLSDDDVHGLLETLERIAPSG